MLNFPTCLFQISQQRGIPTAGLRHLLCYAANFGGVGGGCARGQQNKIRKIKYE